MAYPTRKMKPGPKPRKANKKGRNKKFCEKYQREDRRRKNKLRRLRKHVIRHPNDQVALDAETTNR